MAKDRIILRKRTAVDDLSDNMLTANRIKEEELKLNRERLDFERNTKDRVDISLTEYNEMKSKIGILEELQIKQLRLIETFKLERFVDRVVPGTLKIETMRDPMTCSTRVCIVFNCNSANEFGFENPNYRL